MAKRKAIKAPVERPVPVHEVVRSSYYLAPNGVRYSAYSSYIPEGSRAESDGWTIRWNDGTEGTGRKAFETEAEAHAYLAKVPKYFKGMSAMGD